MNLRPDLEKLSMLDEQGHKLRIYPAEVSGFFRKHRTWTQAILILIFLIIPWIRVGGHQAVLLNIPDRKFAFFGLTLWAHDAPLLLFIFAMLTLGLALVTAVWGRVWCGWACPQTVFLDGLFRRVETWIEGNHLKRRARDQGPFSFENLLRKWIKWIIFFLLSAIISHSFLAYFVGAERLIDMMQSSPKENWFNFVLVFVVTGILTFDFGWFREQFCIIVCPYGRFQSVLMDRSTVTVLYDEKRGEPRKGSPGFGERKGDCVNCSRCIQVCPTGIDIRNGVQLECIACTACIDACDEIMTKVDKPKGLIRYMNLKGAGTVLWRPRTIAYMVLISLAFIGLTYSLATRQNLHIRTLRAQQAPYVIVKDETGLDTAINHVRLHIINQTFDPVMLSFAPGSDWEKLGLKLKMQATQVELGSGESKEFHFFVTSPQEIFKGHGKLQTQIKINNQAQELTLVGPI